MRTITTEDLKKDLDKYLELAAAGEEIRILRMNGKELAMLVTKERILADFQESMTEFLRDEESAGEGSDPSDAPGEKVEETDEDETLDESDADFYTEDERPRGAASDGQKRDGLRANNSIDPDDEVDEDDLDENAFKLFSHTEEGGDADEDDENE